LLEFRHSVAAVVPKVVAGKPIDQLLVGKLARSGDMSLGFNAALQQNGEKPDKNEPLGKAANERLRITVDLSGNVVAPGVPRRGSQWGRNSAFRSEA